MNNMVNVKHSLSLPGRNAIMARPALSGLVSNVPVNSMEDSRKRDHLDDKIKVLSVFHEIGKALTSTLNLNQVLQVIMDKISDLFRPDTWSLLLVDEQTGELYFEIATGEAAEALKQVRLQPGEGIAGWV